MPKGIPRAGYTVHHKRSFKPTHCCKCGIYFELVYVNPKKNVCAECAVKRAKELTMTHRKHEIDMGGY